MKFTLRASCIALALLGATSMASASTSVTLYGVISSGLGWQELKGTQTNGTKIKNTKTGIIDSAIIGNQFGFKGKEDINGDVSAVFMLEGGMAAATGESFQDGRLFGRQATVGLDSKTYGLIELGRQLNLTSRYLAGVASPFSANGWQVGTGATMPAANAVRYDNLVLYQTPTYSGFQGGVGYSFNTNGTQKFKTKSNDPTVLDQDQANAKAITAGLRYNNGPLGLALTYEQVKHGSLRSGPAGTFTSADSGKVHSWNLAASYDFKVVRVYSGIGQSRNGFVAPSLASNQLGAGYVKDLRFNSYTLGAAVPVAQSSTVLLTAGFADPRSVPTGAQKKTQKSYSAAFLTDLSKRTSLYAMGSVATNAGFHNKMRSSLASAGVTHKF